MIQPTTTTFQAKFSQAFREFVQSHPLTPPSTSKSHEAFAAYLNVPTGHVVNWLNGTRLPEGWHIRQIAKKLGSHVYTWFNDLPESPGYVDFTGKPYAVERSPEADDSPQHPRYRNARIARTPSDYFELNSKIVLSGREYDVTQIQGRVDAAGCLWLKVEVIDSTGSYQHHLTCYGQWQIVWA